MIHLFLFKILQDLPDMSLIRLDRDAVATQLDDTIRDSSNLLEVHIFCLLFLGLVFS